MNRLNRRSLLGISGWAVTLFAALPAAAAPSRKAPSKRRRSSTNVKLSAAADPKATSAPKGPGKPVVIGAQEVLYLRVGDKLNGRDMTVEDRIYHIDDVFAKHLGGRTATVSLRAIGGGRIHLYLNGDFVLAVTPADAAATGYKSSTILAPIWQKALQRAFARSSAQK
jgi:hypothetical protein